MEVARLVGLSSWVNPMRPKSWMRAIVIVGACLVVSQTAGCTKRPPLDVRFSRHVDEVRLEALPQLGGSIVLLIDPAFWSSREKTSRIPVARREKKVIIGPGAAEMAGKMLSRMFDEVETARILDRVEDLDRFDFVVRLVHDFFDDSDIFLFLGSRQRYRIGLRAEVSRPDGTPVDRVHAVGSEAFWIVSLGEANPLEGDERTARKAGETLNLAVQETLFELMEEIAALPEIAAARR